MTERVTATSDVAKTPRASAAFTVQSPVATPTTSTLTVSPARGPAGAPVTLSGTARTLEGTIPAGTCQFTDDSATPNLLGEAPLRPEGSCTFVIGQVTAGRHTFQMHFVPGDPARHSPSTSYPVTGNYQEATPAGQVDRQSIEVTVPHGALTIFTPYTAQHPLDLGQLQLSADGKSLSAQAAFEQITISDTRAGNLGWSASLTRSDFVSAQGDRLPAALSGLEQITPHYLPGNALTTVQVHDLPAGTPMAGAALIATAQAGHSIGSVELNGIFRLADVPTSAPPGAYAATVVFTIT